MNEKELIRKAMAALGRRTSKAKTIAVRENGKKGGRPKGGSCLYIGQSINAPARFASGFTEPPK